MDRNANSKQPIAVRTADSIGMGWSPPARFDDTSYGRNHLGGNELRMVLSAKGPRCGDRRKYADKLGSVLFSGGFRAKQPEMDVRT